MTEIRRVPSSSSPRQKRHVVGLAIAVGFMLAAVVQLEFLGWLNATWRVALLVLLFMSAIMVVACSSASEILGGFPCPQCRNRCKRSNSGRIGDPVRYRCVQCDIDWDTGATYSQPND